jgi:non-ribosomal peptide synthase protein (TIGR01720 family)
MHDGGRLLESLAEQRISMLEMVPSPLRALLDQAEAEGRARPLPALRWLVATGEALPPALVRRWLGLFPRATVVNAWGATETSDDVTHHAVDTPPPPQARQIPVGRPAGNCSVLVLEPSLQPAPPGVPGELYIGGVMVGRGYHRDPARTALAFVPHPLATEPGERLYRTGDLGRWSRDGVVEFIGRVDHQVKIRGFRVELGEVQAVLAQHPRVDEVMVLDRDHPPGVKRLVAYVVAGQGETGGSGDDAAAPDAGELREFLRQRLPEYMVPAFFLFLDALPVTPNGKVNRRALLAMELPERGGDEGQVVAPRNAVEAALAEIWAAVLRLDRVSVEDNFFALGGDSILSIQIVAKATRAGLRVTPRQLFTHQTISELAAAVTAAPSSADAVPAEAAAAAATGPFPLTPVQRRFFALGYADPHHYNQSMLLNVHRPLDAASLTAAVAAVVERHDALRQRFAGSGDGARAEIVADAGAPPVHRLDLSALPAGRGSAAVEAAAAALQGSLDLDAGPLGRFALFDLAGGETTESGAAPPSRLLLVLHHLAVDGVSWPVLLEDLQTAHAQAAAGAAPILPPVPTAYRDWAAEVARYAASPRLAAEAPYWIEQAERAAALVQPLPRDGAGANRVADEETVARLFDDEETRALLRDLPERYGAAVEDALLAALAVGHRRWSAAPALWIDVEGHGREEAVSERDLSRTVGWFTAIYPLLLAVETPDDPEAALLAVKEAVRRVPHRGVGYGALRWTALEDAAEDAAARDAARRLAAAPQREIIFNYHGQAGGAGGRGDDGGAAQPVFTAARESDGPSQSRRARRAHLLEVTAGIAGGRLRLAWTYARGVHRPARVEALADACADALRELVDHLRGGGEAAYTPSDFDLVDLDQGQLDKVLSAVRGDAGGKGSAKS